LPATRGAQRRYLDGVLVNRHDGQPFYWNGFHGETRKILSAATSRTPRVRGRATPEKMHSNAGVDRGRDFY
jgi:hypothetical protein